MAIKDKAMKYLTGNRWVQNFLESLLRKILKLMGIGSGGDVNTSGEIIAILRMQALLKPPYTIFDVGANQGQFLKLASSSMQDMEYTIHCFEPASDTFRLLTENAKSLNKKDGIILNHCGLGKSIGQYDLYYNEPGSEIASLTKRRVDHFDIDFSLSETVQIDTLDNYCQSNSIEQIDLLKVDVEGHELDVFQAGAASMLQKNAVKIISFEFGGCNIDTRTFFQDFFYLFQPINMNLFRITPSGYLHPIDSYKEIYEQFCTTNFLAIHKSLYG